ncbi:MAG: LysR family transcriptional regulator [Verrucomicrobiaceae bacterium]|nr:LysR family transcriptional regulator [Verrucomicrobiaceae bacterium]
MRDELSPLITSVTISPHAHLPIDSHHLLVFCTVCKAGSITKAAEALCLTRTALSHALKCLEMDLGCLLFYRHQKSIEITEAGAQLLPKALEILRAMSDFRGSVPTNLTANEA